MNALRSRPPAAWQSKMTAAVALAVTLCASASPAAAQDSFGRLFLTPAQRVQIDESRRLPTAQPARTVPGAPAPAQPQSLSVDGIVRRSDGQATVWLNRTPIAAPQTGGTVRIGPVGDAADGADLRLPDNGRRVRIKVGQEVDIQSGRVQERYRQPVPAPAAPGAATPAETANVPGAGSAGSDGPPAPATRGDALRELARDAAVERLLRELGRRLDEPPREPVRAGDQTR
ncbi:MAG: hypothetical protein LW923_09960 [Betaproteobacteria bacterium]|nr:hypothetical protein [Betaproteobacteria bacterium]